MNVSFALLTPAWWGVKVTSAVQVSPVVNVWWNSRLHPQRTGRSPPVKVNAPAPKAKVCSAIVSPSPSNRP